MDKTSKAIRKLAKELPQSDYRYYTTLATANKIINGKCTGNKTERFVFVSPLSKMNDLDEVELHKTVKDNVYALCFSNSDSESIPMWYLYSGLLGNGVSIKFTAGAIQKQRHND